MTTMIESKILVFLCIADKLMGQPSDGVGFAAPGGMLDEVTLTCPSAIDVCQ